LNTPYIFSLHNTSFRKTSKREPLLGKGFWWGPCFCFMQLFIHCWYDGDLQVCVWRKNV